MKLPAKSKRPDWDRARGSALLSPETLAKVNGGGTDWETSPLHPIPPGTDDNNWT